MRTTLFAVLLAVASCERAPLDRVPADAGGGGGGSAGAGGAGATGAADEVTPPLRDGGSAIDDEGDAAPAVQTAGDAGVDRQAADASGSPDAASAASPAIAAACARPAHRISVPPAQVGGFLTRRWILCSEQGLGQRPQAGLEVRPDGRWAFLGWTTDGQLAAMTGVENEGTVSLHYTPDTGQVDFQLDLGGTVSAAVVYRSEPDSIEINNNGAFTYRYVAADTVALPLSPVPQPILETRPPSGSCDDLPGPRNFVASVAEARAALSRRWILCSKMGLPGGAVGGIEVTADDHYYFLHRQADGVLAHGPYFDGTIEYLDVGPQEGRPVIQVNIDVGFGTIISQLIVTRSPTFLLLNNNGAYEYRYRALE
jgi:hypothetical protein